MNTSLNNLFESNSILHADGQRYTMSLGVVKNSAESKAQHSGFGIIRPRVVGIESPLLSIGQYCPK
jgi:hypothetical protein